MFLFYAILMLGSLLGMVVIVGMKITELRGNHHAALSRISAKGDPIISKWIDTCEWLVGHVNFNNIKKLSIFISHNIFHIFGIAGLFIHKHYNNFADKIRGRRLLQDSENRGPVSFFLKNMAESKEENKKDLN